jgi:glycosyltransferase involved in cell wall biosynthesis
MSAAMSATAPLVSVVVPAYGRTPLLCQAVKSLIDQDLPAEEFEIIVADSSTDERNEEAVAALIPTSRAALRYFRKEPEGPGPSRNLGISHARGQIVAFMDSDCRADPGWLKAGLAAFDTDIGLVQGKTLPDPGGRQSVLTWCPTTERENFVYECTSIFYLKAAVEQAGGFPADSAPRAETPLGGEDVTLAWTVKRLGWRSRFAADAVVYHEVVQLSLWRWLCQERLILWPGLVCRFPELRRHFFARYFWDRGQAFLCMAIVGLFAAWQVSLWALVLALPYLVYRGVPSSETFRGPLRPLRVAPHLARDTISLLILVTGSVRSRTLLL